jgi:hypothetical protein
MKRRDVSSWHVCDMPNGSEQVCLWGKTGSHRSKSKTALLTPEQTSK